MTAIAENYANVATINSAQTLPATDGVNVVINKPPARLNVLKWVSPFKDGSDGDGNPSFGTGRTLSVTYSTQIPAPSVWFKVIVRNTGGQPATGVVISDSRGALPFGQNNANADCPAAPSSLGAGAVWECRYRVALTSTSPPSTDNTASATATNVAPDADNSTTATVTISQCTGTNRTVPSLIGLDKGASNTAWTAAGFTGALTTWTGQPNALTVAQSRPAYECVPATSAMTASRTVTP